MKEMKNLDQGYEVIITGVEMIDAVIEAHKELWGNKEKTKEDHPKEDHPSGFAQSLQEERRRR